VQGGNVAFFCGVPYYFVRAVEKFRQVEPHRPIVCVFEDIDAIIERYGDSELLQWLDGNHQVNKTVNIATTNYPEKLDPRIVARPRRFDRVLRIESPDARLREAYFARKLPEQPAEERQAWVAASEGLSFAALAELVISVYCLENDLEETVRRLRKQDQNTATSEEYAGEATSSEWVFDAA
jgi:SpoVK/Ycf46/Vps4 family AAA+-type ATPase